MDNDSSFIFLPAALAEAGQEIAFKVGRSVGLSQIAGRGR